MDNDQRNQTKAPYTIVLDAGTTAVKACIFDRQETLIAKSSQVIEKSFPQNGWVEQNPAEILSAAIRVLQDALNAADISPSDITKLGIATQRETVVAWNTTTSESIYPAIVWQDTRTAASCNQFSPNHRNIVQEKTGLPIDPYFSASKIRWILDNVQTAKQLLSTNKLAVGTIDSFLLWNLAQGSPHLTDYTNASRTLLFNIHTLEWDHELLEVFGIPSHILPEIKPSHAAFGTLRGNILGSEVAILAMAGDQQASLYAAGTQTGTTKITYGTGTFLMQIIGSTFKIYDRFFTTLAAGSKQPWFAIEAKVTSGVPNTDEILHNPSLLQNHIQHLVASANAYLDSLPQKPKEIVIDGGWIRDNTIFSIQSKLSSYPVREQVIYDGTALGIYRLLQEERT